MSEATETTTVAATEAEAAAPVPAAPNGYVSMQKQVFHFKKEKLRDDKGNVVGEGEKLPSAELYMPIPTVSRLLEILQDTTDKFAKERELLMGAVSDVVYDVVRGQINAFRDVEANKKTPITQAVLNLDKLDWTAIANMPKSERGTSVPSDEDQQSFFDSYLEVMPEATNKGKDKIENHIAIFKTGFKKQRNQKDFLEVFRNALLVYISNAPAEAVEDNQTVVEYFNNKLERMLKAEEKITMDDI